MTSGHLPYLAVLRLLRERGDMLVERAEMMREYEELGEGSSINAELSLLLDEMTWLHQLAHELLQLVELQRIKGRVDELTKEANRRALEGFTNDLRELENELDRWLEDKPPPSTEDS